MDTIRPQTDQKDKTELTNKSSQNDDLFLNALIALLNSVLSFWSAWVLTITLMHITISWVEPSNINAICLRKFSLKIV